MGSSQSLRLSPGAIALFAAARDMQRVEAMIASNLSYIQYLEDGTTRMAARPVIVPYLAEYRDMVDEELRHAFAQYPNKPQDAAIAGISMAALRIMRAMSDRTAQPAGNYFTGRAKGSWTAYLPGGRTVAQGPVITAEDQRAILKNRRKAARDAAK